MYTFMIRVASLRIKEHPGLSASMLGKNSMSSVKVHVAGRYFFLSP